MPIQRTALLATFALASAIALSGCIDGVLGPVSVGDGESRREANTVNGSVHVGDNAKVGEAVTVNGGVHIGKNVIVGEVRSVNGRINVGSNTKVRGDVGTVNGGIRLDHGADVSGDVVNINGGITLASTHVGGSIGTVNGDIDVGSGSHVENGIHVEGTDSYNSRVPRIVIGPNATVNGTLEFEREVELYVSDTATIGRVVGATPIRFSGEQPDGRIASRE
jgi:predicted acyltransferase (DUF342 family)